MTMDFNDAEPQRTNFDLIPAKTECRLIATIKSGGAGDGGWLTASKSSDVQYLSFEFTVLEGKFSKRKIWQNFTVSGGKLDEKGQSKSWGITKSLLRGMLDSAYGLDPDDMSPAATAKRRTNGWGDFNGLEFTALIGTEKGTNGYPDKNKISSIVTRKGGTVTPSQPTPSFSGSAPAQAQASTAQNSSLPAWAR